MPSVLVTMPFGEALLDRIRAVSPTLRVTQARPAEADYSDIDILYANEPPDPAQAPKLQWVQLHLAGVDAIRDYPIFKASSIPMTTTSGVHAAASAEFALTSL